jgi:hypothetical protein
MCGNCRERLKGSEGAFQREKMFCTARKKWSFIEPLLISDIASCARSLTQHNTASRFAHGARGAGVGADGGGHGERGFGTM